MLKYLVRFLTYQNHFSKILKFAGSGMGKEVFSYIAGGTMNWLNSKKETLALPTEVPNAHLT